MNASLPTPNEVQPDQLKSAEQFVTWLKESDAVLASQIATGESLQEALTGLNIERSMQNLDTQRQFLLRTQPWHDQCNAFWSALGYAEINGERGLAPWLESQRAVWTRYPIMKELLEAWGRFRSNLSRIQELNSLNQVLVEQLSEDNRRKLHALVEFAGIGNTIYTSEGDTQVNVSANTVASAGLAGGGRLLGKG